MQHPHPCQFNMMKLLKQTLFTLSLFTAGVFAQGSLIPYVSEANATGDIKKIYSEVKADFGMIPTPIMQHSVSPALLANHWNFFKAIGQNKNFSPKFLAIMRMTIATSGIFQHCDYCVKGNAMMLKQMFKMTDKDLKAIQKDPSKANFNKKESKMLSFLLTATSDSHSLNKASFDELRKLGWSDKDIFEGLKMATQMVAAIYMVNSLHLAVDFK